MPKGPQANHTACRKNTLVVVKLIDGTIFEDKFMDRIGHNKIVFKEHGIILKKNIRLFAVKKRRQSSLK